jgi:hypothetical protein
LELEELVQLVLQLIVEMVLLQFFHQLHLQVEVEDNKIVLQHQVDQEDLVVVEIEMVEQVEQEILRQLVHRKEIMGEMVLLEILQVEAVVELLLQELQVHLHKQDQVVTDQQI